MELILGHAGSNHIIVPFVGKGLNILTTNVKGAVIIKGRWQ